MSFEISASRKTVQLHTEPKKSKRLSKVFCNRVIGRGYPKFTNGEMEWPPTARTSIRWIIFLGLLYE